MADVCCSGNKPQSSLNQTFTGNQSQFLSSVLLKVYSPFNISSGSILGGNVCMYLFIYLLLSPEDIFSLLLEREEGRWGWEEKGREREICCLLAHTPTREPTTWVCALTRNRTHDPSVYTTMFQPTEPHYPGLDWNFFLQDLAEVTFLL